MTVIKLYSGFRGGCNANIYTQREDYPTIQIYLRGGERVSESPINLSSQGLNTPAQALELSLALSYASRILERWVSTQDATAALEGLVYIGEEN